MPNGEQTSHVPQDNNSINTDQPFRESIFSLGLKMVLLQLMTGLVAAVGILVCFYFLYPAGSTSLLITLLIILSLLLQTVDAAILIQLVVHWRSVSYSVTPKEIVVNKGLARLETDVYKTPSVQGVEVRQSPLGKLFNYGTLSFAAPGPKGKVEMPNIPDPWLYEEVIKQTK